MVCVAAFIVLGLMGVFVAVVSIFKREVGRAYLKLLQKSWGCVGKKVRLQKCDTNFKEDVRNSLLRKIVLTHPTWIAPLSRLIEILSVIIVFVFAWAVATSLKSLLALWALGTCNVERPASCTLGSEACSLGDESGERNLGEHFIHWFTEWGDIFEAIPDRVKTWQAEDYFVQPTVMVDPTVLGLAEQQSVESGDGLIWTKTDGTQITLTKPADYALDIIDPGCSACMMSYRNQLASDFFLSHRTALLIYPIQLENGNYKFANSGLFARYFYAAAYLDPSLSLKLLNRLFTEKNSEGIIYQSYFANLSATEAETELQTWLREFGLKDTELKTLLSSLQSAELQTLLNQVETIVKEQIHIKGIPTLIYNHRKHFGLYAAK